MQKEVLVLGAGMVVRPLVHYLSRHSYKVVVASRTLAKAQKVVEGTAHGVAVQCDVEHEDGQKQLHDLVPTADAVISMLPYLLHPVAAKIALAYNKHFLTTSYVSPAMKELEAEARSKNLVIINECGVDPGTDHMSAMKVIHNVEKRGGKIVSFTSYCGGLPAPKDNNNPLGYKLSWSPRGVLLASRNDARFLAGGEEVFIPGADLFDNFQVEFVPELDSEYETYPNRNSLQYIDIYGLQGIQKMIRGTYRNKGWCTTVKKLVDLGLLDIQERSWEGQTYVQLVKELISSTAQNNPEDLKAELKAFLKLDESNMFVLHNIEWLGLLSDERIPDTVNTRLDALCRLMEARMQYAPGECDMLLMRHTFLADFPDDKQEKITCTLVDYGIQNGDSSMSRTVSLPVAIATRLVLEGQYTVPGLSIPIIPELYNPILDELENLDIKFIENYTTL